MSSNPVNSPNLKLEVVVFSVSNVDQAKAFYENLGWRLDIDIAAGDFCGVQVTSPNSEASIIFGEGDMNPKFVRFSATPISSISSSR